MSVTWSQRLDPVALRVRLAARNGGVMRDLLRRGLLVESAAKRNLSGIGGPKRIDTGRLRAEIHTLAIDRNGQPIVLVISSLKYSRFVHDGTGIYGPRGTPIRPRSHKFLRFKPRGATRWVYARQVKGMRPNPFLKNALIAARG